MSDAKIEHKYSMADYFVMVVFVTLAGAMRKAAICAGWLCNYCCERDSAIDKYTHDVIPKKTTIYQLDETADAYMITSVAYYPEKETIA